MSPDWQVCGQRQQPLGASEVQLHQQPLLAHSPAVIFNYLLINSLAFFRGRADVNAEYA